MSQSDGGFSRREFLSAAILAPLAASQLGAAPAIPAPRPSSPAAPPPPPGPSSLLDVDFAALLARSDLRYERPAPRSEEGIPVGNGRMGSLVWTTPRALRLQINRADVYANDSTTTSFFERNGDYCGGCGFVEVGLGEVGPEVFPAAGFPQHLSVHHGRLEVEGKGVTAELIAWPEKDVMAIAIDDRRPAPEPVRVDLRMLRFASQYFGGELEKLVASHTVAVQTRNHRADSRLEVRGERIVLTQEFREGKYLNRSAVAIGAVGRRGLAAIPNEAGARLTVPAGRGRVVLLIASAASFDPAEDVAATALAQLEAAAAKGQAALAAETAAWWHDFWSRGFVRLHSDDGVADRVQENYHYFLYLMGATSRGAFPPKFNGMLWNTAGDLRTWGAQHWFANLSCYYEAIPATNRLELLDPVYSMYFGMHDASAVAARQQWGSEGIYIAETSYFNGLAELPEDVAAEMRELYLMRKPWEERSARFRELAETGHPHSSRWNWVQSAGWVGGHWVLKERGSGPYGNVTHILGTTPKIAFLFWRRYEYTGDEAWLRERAYPMLKGAAEFYRNFPNLRRGADGKYHIHFVNSNESVWGGTDTDEDLSAMRGVLPAAIRAAEILGVDPELRAAWGDLLANLAPIPTSDLPGALHPEGYAGPRVFVRALRPVVKGENAFLPDQNSLPMWFFDLCGVESADARARETAASTFAAFFRDGITEETPVSVLSKNAIAAAAIGRADAVKYLIPNQIDALRPERSTAYRDGGVLANRMTLREGPQALDAQRLGRAAEALHQALLQSAPPAPGGDPVIRVFPAWPAEWDASYTLLARGAFLVTSAIRRGKVGFVELESRLGGECRLRNPWGEGEVTLHRDGKRAESLAGSLLRFPTRRSERVVVVVSGDSPEAHRGRVGG